MSHDVPLLQARQVVASRPSESGQLQCVLQETNLEVGAGEVLAVVGPSGSGKSTVLKLITRMVNGPDDGSVMVDDVDVTSCTLESLRERVGVVPQDTCLFDNTILFVLTDNGGSKAMSADNTPLRGFKQMLDTLRVILHRKRIFQHLAAAVTAQCHMGLLGIVQRDTEYFIRMFRLRKKIEDNLILTGEYVLMFHRFDLRMYKADAPCMTPCI